MAQPSLDVRESPRTFGTVEDEVPKYVFFDDTVTKSTDIIPVDNVAAITVARPSRSRSK